VPRVELSGKRGWNRAVEIVKDDTYLPDEGRLEK